MTSTIIIAVVTVVLFMASVLFLPSVGKNGKFKIYPLIPFVGGILMILFGNLSIGQVLTSFTENTSVNPIKILVLFLSMTVYSLILDRTGFFGYISGVVLKHAGHNQYAVFFSLYAVIAVLTVFTSNDIVILTFTPFICKFCRSAKIDVVPYLIMEFVVANTWSILLLIGNPTNIYISGAFGISFAEYFIHMALPTVAAGAVSLGVMLLIFGKRLRTPINTDAEVQEINDKPLMTVALSHLIACIVLLAISQYTGIEMWLISLGVSASAVIASLAVLAARKKSLAPIGFAIKGMPFEIVPFVIGMFIIVMGLDNSGITAFLSEHIKLGDGIFSYGFASLFSSNLLNNIPMSVLFSKILSVSPSMPDVYATIIGSNIGAFLTPIGALAGIMWSNLIKENDVKLSVGRFVVYGAEIAVPTMTASLLVVSALG
ncbi:MAG: hypothetical protein E7677_04750 [Ruminococcaceae bacterium]|nr:hypothetical protein [Oscillospiraceae bacterium]